MALQVIRSFFSDFKVCVLFWNQLQHDSICRLLVSVGDRHIVRVNITRSTYVQSKNGTEEIDTDIYCLKVLEGTFSLMHISQRTWHWMNNIFSALLKLRWNYDETWEYVWFEHSFTPEIPRFSKFPQCRNLGCSKFQTVSVHWYLLKLCDSI